MAELSPVGFPFNNFNIYVSLYLLSNWAWSLLSLSGLGDAANNGNGVAVARLTTHLEHVVNEKNDIVAQLCSQQQLIKDQQQELKILLRCKTENNDLCSQISSLKKSVQVLQTKLNVSIRANRLPSCYQLLMSQDPHISVNLLIPLALDKLITVQT